MSEITIIYVFLFMLFIAIGWCIYWLSYFVDLTVKVESSLLERMKKLEKIVNVEKFNQFQNKHIVDEEV